MFHAYFNWSFTVYSDIGCGMHASKCGYGLTIIGYGIIDLLYGCVIMPTDFLFWFYH